MIAAVTPASHPAVQKEEQKSSPRLAPPSHPVGELADSGSHEQQRSPRPFKCPPWTRLGTVAAGLALVVGSVFIVRRADAGKVNLAPW